MSYGACLPPGWQLVAALICISEEHKAKIFTFLKWLLVVQAGIFLGAYFPVSNHIASDWQYDKRPICSRARVKSMYYRGF